MSGRGVSRVQDSLLPAGQDHINHQPPMRALSPKVKIYVHHKINDMPILYLTMDSFFLYMKSDIIDEISNMRL